MTNTLNKTKLSNYLNRDRTIIPVFIVAVLFYWMGLYLYSPTLPLYVQDKTDNLAVVGVVLSMYGLWQLLARLPLGILIDWVGLAKTLHHGWFGGGWDLGLVMGHAQEITMLGIGRALSGGIGCHLGSISCSVFQSVYAGECPPFDRFTFPGGFLGKDYRHRLLRDIKQSGRVCVGLSTSPRLQPVWRSY